MTHFVRAIIYCPDCGNELQSEYEDRRDVVFIGQIASLVKPSLYLYCDSCGWGVKDKEALQHLQSAIDELQR